MAHRLGVDFFARDTLLVAKELLGKKIIFHNHQAVITETEAYIGKADPACHAARGRTKRTEVMFDRAGISYVYLIYGMYHCLNFVTEKKDFPAAVLIRGVKIEADEKDIILDGPGKLCKYLGITREHNYIDITESNFFYVADSDYKFSFISTPRIGISRGKDKLWRFVVDDKKM